MRRFWFASSAICLFASTASAQGVERRTITQDGSMGCRHIETFLSIAAMSAQRDQKPAIRALKRVLANGECIELEIGTAVMVLARDSGHSDMALVRPVGEDDNYWLWLVDLGN
jgi:hypothetical protein